MTTIATDGKSICGDGQATGDHIYKDFRKVIKVKGKLYGMCGDSSFLPHFKEWVVSGEDLNSLPDRAEILKVTKSGDVFTAYTGSFSWFKQDDGFTAIGSGRDFAIGALRAGASPKKAVKIASKHDVYTGGKITVIKF